MTQRQVIVRDAGHQALDELDAADIPALSYETAGAAATAASGAASALASHEADTTAIHGITNTASLYVAGGTDVAVADGGTGASTASGARTNLGLGTAAVAATGDFDAAGAAASAQSAAIAASQPVDSDLTAIAALTTTSYGRAFLALADAAAARTAAGLGTLATQSGTFSGTSSGTNTGDQTLPTRASLGLDTSDSPQFAGVNVGAATDTTITRTGAGDIAVEGNALYRAGGTDVAVADGGTGASTAATARTNLGVSVAGISFVIDGGGATITTGAKGYVEVPFACTITAVRLQADQTGSVVVDIKKATYSGLPTTASIAASAKPTLSSARKYEDSTLTGWTTSIAAGDWLEYVVDSITTCQRVTVSLTVAR